MMKLVLGALGLAVVLGAASGVGPAPAPRILAACNDMTETTDSFSMDCAPNVLPDVSDQLTEAEVSQPGWNAAPGGGGGPHH